MQIAPCPACGWPTPKGRPCPRGCGAAVPAAPAQAYTTPQALPTQALPPSQAGPSYSLGPSAVPAAASASLESRDASTVGSERRLHRHLAGPAGIGGALLLPIIGLLATICWNAWNIYYEFLPLRQSDVWTALTTQGSSVYHWLWQPLALFEVFASVVMILAPMALLVMIFRKRRAVRGSMVAFYVFVLAATAFDSGACLLVMTGWLRSLGLQEVADSVSSGAWRSLIQAVPLAAIWIPYFLRSRRVKNTFALPEPAVRRGPTRLMPPAARGREGDRRLRAALAVVAIVAVAGAAAYGFAAHGGPPGGSDFTSTVSGPVDRSMSEADAAYAAGDLRRAAMLYEQAIQADPDYEAAYYRQWSALFEQEDYSGALEAAARITQLFPGSREGWFALGFTQEANGDLGPAVESYTACLALGDPDSPGGGAIDDTFVQERLELCTYVSAIGEPRVAIADAVNRLNDSLEEPDPDMPTLAGAAGSVSTVVEANIVELEKIVAPSSFSAFQTGMLTAYRDLQAACDDLAAAALEGDSGLLTAARENFYDAIDTFNQNDMLGTSLMNDYYGQEPPVALLRPVSRAG